MGTDSERIVLEFVRAAYGERMDVDAMTALMSDDFVWQLNVPLSPVIRGRDAARAELERHNQMSSGMVDGSEIRAVVANDDTVVVERLDVNVVFGKRLTFHVTSIFDVRDGSITGWREYWDTGDVAQQLGIDPSQMFRHIGG
jgi:limonene-1,2-epoxide hydrolase